MNLVLHRDAAAAAPNATDATGTAGKAEADHLQQLTAIFRAPPG